MHHHPDAFRAARPVRIATPAVCSNLSNVCEMQNTGRRRNEMRPRHFRMDYFCLGKKEPEPLSLMPSFLSHFTHFQQAGDLFNDLRGWHSLCQVWSTVLLCDTKEGGKYVWSSSRLWLEPQLIVTCLDLAMKSMVTYLIRGKIGFLYFWDVPCGVPEMVPCAVDGKSRDDEKSSRSTHSSASGRWHRRGVVWYSCAGQLILMCPRDNLMFLPKTNSLSSPALSVVKISGSCSILHPYCTAKYCTYMRLA